MTKIGLSVGGQQGSALARHLGIFTSTSTLLRLAHKSEVPELPPARVLGIDDWAFRKGHTYGPILVDLESRRPVDLLPGSGDHRQIWRHLRSIGFKGIYRYVQNAYPDSKKAGNPHRNLPKLQVWIARQVAICLTKPARNWTENEKSYLEILLGNCPIFEKAQQLATEFYHLLMHKKPEQFDGWMAQVMESGIESLQHFAIGLKAVKAAMTLKVEGHQVNRLKTIKRQMYGRAGFQLLRRRILFRSD